MSQLKPNIVAYLINAIFMYITIFRGNPTMYNLIKHYAIHIYGKIPQLFGVSVVVINF